MEENKNLTIGHCSGEPDALRTVKITDLLDFYFVNAACPTFIPRFYSL